MDIDDDGVTDPAAEFGELFEGQNVSFENDLEAHDADDVLGSLGHHIGLDPSGHHDQESSHHPTEHDILAANLPFVTGDYLQQQHITLHSQNEGTDYAVTVPTSVTQVNELENQNKFILHEANQSQIYVPQSNLEQPQGVVNSGPITYKLNDTSNLGITGTLEDNGGHKTEQNDEPKIKKKVKIVKSVEHFANENMEKYLTRRGFKSKKGPINVKKSISKAVLALSADAEISKHRSKLVSFRARYEPENVVQEMERFWKFYLTTKRSQLTSVSSELLPMLIPMLLHFYFEMTLTNLFPIARRICYEFSKKFFHEDKTQEQYEILVAIMKVSTVEMLKSDEILGKLINKKYEFVLSETTISHLRRFLAKSTQPILLNLFTDRFKIKCRDTKELFESFDWESMLNSESESSSESSDEDLIDSMQNCDDPDSSKKTSYAEEIIKTVRNSVMANLPAISVYTVGNDPVCGSVSRTGSLIAYGLSEAGIRICSTECARDVTQIESSDYQSSHEFESYGIRSVGGHAGTVYGVHFHPRTKLLFSVGQDSFMRAWDLNLEVPPCKVVYRGHVGPIWNLDMPNSGSMVATCGLDTTARIFLPERCEFVRMMAGHYFSVNTVKFHPNESYIATGSVDKSVRLWSVNDGNIVRMFTGSAGSVNCVAFHESGKYLAGAGEHCKILIWDLAEGEVVATLDSLTNCKDLAFTGSLLTACYRNGMLQIFNLRPIVGECRDAINELRQPPIAAPFTSKCFAKTLFKVHYTNPGRLLCLGSDLKQNDDEPKSQEPPSSSEDMQPNNDLSNVMNMGDSDPNPDFSSRETIQPQIPSANSDVDDTSQDTDGSLTCGVSRILASRLSQPLSVSSTSGDEGAKDSNALLRSTSSVSATGAAKSTVSMISSEDLDAAIASVIDQSGGDNSSDAGGGTITMYASS